MTDMAAGDVQGQVVPIQPEGPPMDPALQAAIEQAQQQQADAQAEYECEHELEKAIHAMAQKGQLADGDADSAWRFGQAAHFYAQALQVLRTPPAPPTVPGQMSGERPPAPAESGA